MKKITAPEDYALNDDGDKYDYDDLHDPLKSLLSDALQKNLRFRIDDAIYRAQTA